MDTMKELTVTEPAQLLNYLLANLPSKGRNKVKALLTHRQVAVDGRVVTRHDHPLRPGQRVTIQKSSGTKAAEMHGVRILYEDDDVIVIDKPAGLLSMATDQERDRTAYRALMGHVKQSDPNARVFIVHRLDRETSGVMMFAKSESVQQLLQDNWKETVLERSYIAVVEGTVTKPEGTLTNWLQESKTKTMFTSKPGTGLKAVLHYKVLQSSQEYSLLEVRLDTGRKNQIRVQMQSAGHSVIGDKRYGSRKNPIGRLGLHARVLSFRHPVSKEVLRFETPIPPAFRKLLAGR